MEFDSSSGRLGRLRRIALAPGRGLAVGLDQLVLDAAGGQGCKHEQKNDFLHFSFSRQKNSCSATRAGAVPPRLMRELTDASSDSTWKTSSLMAGSTCRMSA